MPVLTMPWFLAELRLPDLVDIAVVAVLLWLGIAFLRQSQARMALLGLAILGAVYLAAQQLGLQLTARLLQGFSAALVLVLIIVFQEEIRRFFERIAVMGLRREPRRSAPDVTDGLVSAVARLAESHTGALIVLPGREPLHRHIDGGVHLRGRASEALLLSLFDASSPGHDGAVVIEANEIARFAAHLPLSSDHESLRGLGTRHAAALGLAERTDALCIVVSEERGTISLAARGELRMLSSSVALEAELQRFHAQLDPERSRGVAGWMREHWREALLSVGLAAGLWFLLIPGSNVARLEQPVSVVVENLPAGYKLDSIDPSTVLVTIEGRRRDVLLAGPGAMKVRIDALLAQLGRRTFEVTPEHVDLPETLTAVAVDPQRVRIDLIKKEQGS